MKGKKIAGIVLGLAIVVAGAMGTVTAFAANANTYAVEPTAAVQETVPVQQLSAETKDAAAKKDKSGKSGMTFVGIDAVAAEVLGVSEESLVGLNHADQLYAELAEAGKVDEFKTALISAKQAQYDAKAKLGKFSVEELEEKLAGYTQVINDWDGATELIVSSSTGKAKFK